ncbi:MAG: radical SAM family heme chaperone HemW [Bacteroidia bacterium]|nr:radical SAM family heme chaperone HemW [Bacteroidia bacterium]
MAGIYIHIPFCRQACNYCNFYFSTSANQKNDLLVNLEKEISLHENWIYRDIDTVYFGGGTPSLLSPSEIGRLLNVINSNFNVMDDAEITLEANPDDLNPEYLSAIKSEGINRLSIGIQSFINRDLKFMNRIHTAVEAVESIENAISSGFNNINIDLIYGTPGLTDSNWKSNIALAVNCGVQHISAYSLTVETGTVLYHNIRKGKTRNVDEEQSARQFEIVMDRLPALGLEHYEISNFCLPGFRSRHNSSYWRCHPYLGIGPSAHSYDLENRYWNIPNIKKYCDQLQKRILPWNQEKISVEQSANEFILTQIRTSEGINIVDFMNSFGKSYADLVLTNAFDLGEDYLDFEDGKIVLNKKGKLIADHITVKLMI